MRKSIFITALALALPAALMAGPRTERLITDWQFSRDKAQWENVCVPHDWAISGPFDKKWDMQTVAIEQNGEKIPTEKTGRSGSLPWIGEGHYKTTIALPQPSPKERETLGGHYELVFDGAMAEPTVYVNGKKAGYWAYGYNAFRLDITNLVKPGENTLEVDLKNVEESSRWYPGAGLYRPVTLVQTGDVHIDRWETFCRTLYIDKDAAPENGKGFSKHDIGKVAVDTKIIGLNGDNDMTGTEISIINQNGSIVAASHCHADAEGNISTVLDVEKPQLWSPEKPYLYTLRIRQQKNLETVDEITMKVGIRTVKIDKEHGFQLNGKTRKIKGVCLHHDLGPLGTAINKAALIRQVKMLKSMGCDAIRTAHNMPSTWQMEVCDSLGMMVMAESFDMWKYPKCKNGYARFFDEWADKDIENLVKNHRNHPSIIMWSIGNEIPEQGDKKGAAMAKHLQDICHKLDPTRTVTAGCDRGEAATRYGFMQTVDIPGFNYRLHKYEKMLPDFPQGFVLGSETASTVSSRGVYKFPAEAKAAATYPDGQCNGYDTEYCWWSNLPDDDWHFQDDFDWVIGEFVWTGYDYLGEPTPYDEYWPSRSSYFGIMDLAGLPKDRYYLYRSKWNKEEHTTHLLPHWNWGTALPQPSPKGRGNAKTQAKNSKLKTQNSKLIVPVYCYTDGVEGELFVNGKSQGRVKKATNVSYPSGEKFKAGQELDRYRLRWNNVIYEPGEIRVVTFDADGNKIGEDVRRTAGEPVDFKFTVETQGKTLKANGEDLAFITVEMVDKDGTPCPTLSNNIKFKVEGAGTYKAACNGDATSLQVFTEPEMKLFAGQLVAIVQSDKKTGNIVFTATDEQTGLTKSITIAAK